MVLEEGDIVLCTVDRIVGTIVFVKIEDENKEGSIILSEIAPGRIRNLRDYVVPKKKIVCKILRISGEQINLSLRRVSQKEQKEVIERHNQEKSYESLFKSVLGEKSKEVLDKIKEKEKLYDFIEEIKEIPKNLEKLVGKKDSEKIIEIINSQKQKKAILKKEIKLTTQQPNGLELIKQALKQVKNAEVNYISAGRYSIKTEAEDLKKADNLLKENFSEIETFAKKNKMEFSIHEKGAQ